MTTSQGDEGEAQVLTAYRDMHRVMLASETSQLGDVLDDSCTLTHMTGYRQSKRERLAAIASGTMRYHSAAEKSVSTVVTNNTAVVVGKSVVDATIYGSRGTWDLQLTTSYQRKANKWLATNTVATTF